MNIIRFVNGYASASSDKIIYFIPVFKKCDNNQRSIDVTILEVVNIAETKDTGRKYYEGYKVHVSHEMLSDWQKILTPIGQGDDECLDIFESLKKALRYCDSYGLTLGSSKEQPRTIDFWKEKADKNIILLGRVKLETIEIVPSSGRLLETIVLNLQDTAEENATLKMDSKGKEDKQAELQKTLEELIRSKSRMEDRLYRAFTKVLNEKKKRIVELERRVRSLEAQDQTHTPDSSTKFIPQRPNGKRKGPLVPSSSEDDEMSSSPEYKEETDVYDSDVGMTILSKQTPKSSKQKITKSTSSIPPNDKNRPACTRKLFPSETGETSTSTPANKESGDDENVGKPPTNPINLQVDDSETDFTDSSQEFVPKCYKKNNNNDKSKNSSHKNLQNNISSQNSNNTTTPSKNSRNLDSSQTDLSEPSSKKCRLVTPEANRLEKMIDDPNHILNRMFGSL